MNRWASVLLMISIFTTGLSGCSSSATLNEDAEAFLEETNTLREETNTSNEETNTSNEETNTSNEEANTPNEKTSVSNDETNTSNPAIENSEAFDQVAAPNEESVQVGQETGPSQGAAPERKDLNSIDPSDVKNAPEIKVGIQMGMSALSLLGAMKSSDDWRIQVDFDLLQPSELRRQDTNLEDYDVMILPTNTAASLYNRGLKYRSLAVVGWGSQYAVSAKPLDSIEDLKDRRVFVISRDRASEAVLNYLLEKNGLSVNEMDITYVGGLSEITGQQLEDDGPVLIAEEPVLTGLLSRVKNGEIVLNLQEEWNKISGGTKGYPKYSLMVSEDLLDNYPVITGALVKSIENSILWFAENREEAQVYASTVDLGMKDLNLAEMGDRANVHFVNSGEARGELELYMSILLNASERLVGGKMPADEFYFVPPRR